VNVALVSELVSIQPGESFRVGLHMKMNRGWHTYWKQPGDAGLPLRIEWTLPAGFAAGPIEWPAPERIPTGDLMSYGYEHEVLLGVTITPPARVGTDSVTIAGTFDWLECKDVCLAGSAELEIALPVRAGPAKPGPAARLFADTRSRLPRPPEGRSLTATAGPRAIELSFRPPPGVTPSGGYLFVDQPLVAEHAAPQGFERAGDRYRLTVTPAENAAGPPKRITGVLVLDGVSRTKGNAIAVDVEAIPGDPAPARPQQRRSWPSWPLYAIVVGLLGLSLAIAWRRRASRR
jgi:thiol:disulfide interchange protein DsbD